MATTNNQIDNGLTPWWIPTFLMLLLLGFGAAYLAGSLPSPFAGVFQLVIPVGIVACILAFGQGAKRLRHLAMRLCWWHGLWLLLFVSGLVFRARGLEDIRKTPVDPWAAFRIVLVFATALVLIARLVLRKTDWLLSLFHGLAGALAIYALVCGVSTLWSLYPAWTFYKAIEYSIEVALLAGILVSVRSPDEWKTLCDWTWVLVGCISLTVWIGVAIWPTQAFVEGSDLLPGRLAGVFPAMDPNTVGEDAAVLGIIALARLLAPARQKRGGTFYIVLLAYALVTLVFAQTRSAIIGFLLGTGLVFFSAKRRGMLTAFVVGAALLFSFTTASETAGTFWQRNERPEYIQSVTGRLPVWEAAWKLIKERPFLGYGAYAAGRFGVLTSPEESEWSSVLNTYVEVAVGTGILGLAPLLVALLGTWWILIRASSRLSSKPLYHQLATEGLGVLSIVTVRSFATVQLMWHPALVFLVVLGYAEFLRRRLTLV